MSILAASGAIRAGRVTPVGGGGGGGGSNNPDALTERTNVLGVTDYDPQDASEVAGGNNNLLTFNYLATGGYNSTPAWSSTINFENAGGTTEDDAGYVPPYASFSVGETTRLAIMLTRYISQEWIDSFKAHDHEHHKPIDVHLWDSGGTGRGGTAPTRWVCYEEHDEHVDSSTYTGYGDGGIRYALTAGGAGGEFMNDGVNTNPDISQWPDSYHLAIFYFDCDPSTGPVFSLYYKRPGDSGVTKALERDGTVSDPSTLATEANGIHDIAAYIFGYIDNVNTGRLNDSAIEQRLDMLGVYDGYPTDADFPF